MVTDFVADPAVDIALMVALFFAIQTLMHIAIRMHGDVVGKPRDETQSLLVGTHAVTTLIAALGMLWLFV